MTISRRTLVRGLGLGAFGAGTLAVSGCGPGGGRGTRRRPTTTAPTGAERVEPDTPLVIGSIGAAYGRSAAIENTVAIGVREAGIDLNSRFGKLFGHDVDLVERHVLQSADDDLGPVIDALAAAGVSAVITSIDEDALVAAIPALVDAGIAMIDVFTSGMSVRAPEVQSAGMLARLAPNDRVLATRWAEDAWNPSTKAGRPGTVAFVSPDTAQGQSLRYELDQILRPAGGRIVTEHLYAPEDFGDIDAVVTSVVDSAPALLVVNGGPECGPFLSALYAATLDDRQQPFIEVPVRLGAAATVDYSDADLHPECLSRAEGYEPGGELDESHVNMMLNADHSLLSTGYAYSQQAYDAVMLCALAAMDALSVEGTAIAASLPGVLTGTQDCTDYGACRIILRDALVNGERATVSYAGRSGAFELGPDRDVRTGSLRTYTWSQTNALQTGRADTFTLE